MVVNVGRVLFSGPALRLYAIVFLVCLGAAPAAAQGAMGVAGGRVVDETGAGIPWVEISASRDGKVIHQTVSSEDGAFALSLPLGAFSVKASRVGFRAAERQIVLTAPGTLTADFRLMAPQCDENDHPVLNELATVLEGITRIAIVRVTKIDSVEGCPLIRGDVVRSVRGVASAQLSMLLPRYSFRRFEVGEEYLRASYLYTFPVHGDIVEWHRTDRPNEVTRLPLAQALRLVGSNPP